MRLVRALSSPGRCLALACGLLLTGEPAAARLSQNALAQVAIAPPPGARVPGGATFLDANSGGPVDLTQAIGGRATVLLPVDYTCGNVCDPMVSMTAVALERTGLTAGRDYAFVLIGLDPRDDAAAARRMLEADLGGDGLRPQALVGDAEATARTLSAIGYTAAYDADTDSFAHPAAAILLTPEGRVGRVLAPLALNGRDLRLALVEAGEGRTGSIADRLVLLCYGFDAARGVYTPLVRRILAAAGVATITAIALLILLLNRRSRVA